MKQPVPKMTALPRACTICDLWMKRGLIPRSHAGIKGFLMSFMAYAQYDLQSYRNKQDHHYIFFYKLPSKTSFLQRTPQLFSKYL